MLGYESVLHMGKRNSGGGRGCNFYIGKTRFYVHHDGRRNHRQGKINRYGHFHSGGQDHGSIAHRGVNRDQIRSGGACGGQGAINQLRPSPRYTDSSV